MKTVQYYDSVKDFALLLTAHYLAALVLVELFGIFIIVLHCLDSIFLKTTFTDLSLWMYKVIKITYVNT